MMEPGLVSVMMPAYNAEAYIEEAIMSVLAQSYTHWELVVVDDGSTDQTATIANRFADPRINVVHQANRGEAAARNTALRHTHGEFIAFLDADDVYLPRHLEATAGYLLAHPDRGGVYTDGYYCDQNGNRLQTLSSRRRGPFEGRIFEEVVRGSDVFGPPICVVLRHKIIARYDLRFDEDLVIGPDWDFFTRYTDIADFGYLAEYHSLYRLHLSNTSICTDIRKRVLNTARCRMKAVKMPNFGTCSTDTRYAVLYGLLVILLRGFPERQLQIINWPEFRALPVEPQARLLRLMATASLIHGEDQAPVGAWIRRSRELDPRDRRGALLSGIYNLSPLVCRMLLVIRTLGRPDPLRTAPFADIKGVKSA